MDKNCLKICTFNCRSLKNCLPAVYELCNKYDIVLLQEHWLMPNELHVLNSIHSEFQSCGLSAIDISSDILVGRPFGGTGILYRKSLANTVTLVDSDESRITGIQLHTSVGPLLLLNVYMPTNYNDEESSVAYSECLGKLNALMLDAEAIHTVIAGDFNCSPGSRFFTKYADFASDNSMIMSDLNCLKDVSTYISDDGHKSSWIDHVLSSIGIDKLISNFDILNDVIVSDHKPLAFKINCCVSSVSSLSDIQTVGEGTVSRRPIWDECDTATLASYAECVDSLLQHVCVPFDMLIKETDNNNVHDVINKFYNDILVCVSVAVNHSIPSCQYTINDFNVPGWNTYVSEKHDAARQAYMMWLDVSKPRSGYYFENMKRSRAVFKLALRYCREHVDELKADACAESLFDKDCRKFWNNVYKISNKKASCHINSVGGASGPMAVVNMWKTHFEKIYSCTAESRFRCAYEEKLMSLKISDSIPILSWYDIDHAIYKQKRGKAAGPDGLQIEAFVFGGKRLKIYLSMLFNLFLSHGYVPPAFCRSTLIPLVKCKSGDLSDVNNYRAVALSNSVTKILETLLLEFIESHDPADEYQFGFRKNLSTAMCTNVMKQTIDYYRQHGSHVFTCYIDFNKAFDSVDYWLLFINYLTQTRVMPA
jgi:exonuclease III